MRLFDIGEDKSVMLNKVWIMLIPEFATLLKRDKGSAGDYRGDKKLKATREFTFIYFFTDFSSPLRDWEDDERKKEALYYGGLQEEQLDEEVWAAQAKYQELQLSASRPLRTLKALYKGLDALDQYFEDLDFKKTDKQGKLLNDPSATVTNAGKLNKMYDEIRNFEKRVEDDLKNAGTGIRGPNSTLGDQETTKKAWSEEEILKGSRHSAGIDVDKPTKIPSSAGFSAILQITQNQAQKELAEREREQKKLEDSIDNQEQNN